MGTVSPEQLALLTDYDPDSAYALAYQEIYASIRFNLDSKHTRPYVISFTTPSAFSGQAAVATNVAIAAAQSGTPTILVDAHLSAPGIQQRFGLPTSGGLHDLLDAETITPQEIIPYLHTVFVPGLSLLGAGQALLQTQERNRLLTTKLHAIVASLRQLLTEREGGIIIFHSPPVLSGIDATQIGSLADETFLAIVSGQTTRRQATQALEHLQRSQVHVAGTLTVNM